MKCQRWRQAEAPVQRQETLSVAENYLTTVTVDIDNDTPNRMRAEPGTRRTHPFTVSA